MKALIHLFIYIIMCNTLFVKDLQKIPLENKIGILNDKAFFNFPKDTKEEARSVDIMSASKNNNEETRIIYDDGKKRVVFFAKELFKIGDADLFYQVTQGKGEILTYNRKVLTDKDSIYSILSTPTKTNTQGSSMLVNKLLVKVLDGTLFEILAYISPELYKQKEEYMKFTESVFKTLSKGSRTINLKPRKINLQLEIGFYQYEINLPENYSITVNQAYDFKVTKFHKYTKLNTPDEKISIYSGNHASRFYRQYRFKDPDSIIKGTFLKQEINWHLYSNKETNLFLKEEVISLPEDMDLHIAMTGYSSESIDELTKIVESIKFIK